MRSRAANARGTYRRPLTAEPRLADLTPAEELEAADDYREALYEAEQRQDRLLEHSGLNGMGPVSADVVAFPVRDETARAA